LDDLISAGNLGLMTAAVRYRPAEFGGVPFSAYARPLIRRAIQSSFRRRRYSDATTLPLEADRLPAADAEVEISIDRRRTLERVRQVSLSVRQREVLDVYYSQLDPSMSRTAKILNIAEHQAWHAHLTAISAVRRELAA
jgi:RNA polymerase sigma factor (sigma-70 family)